MKLETLHEASTMDHAKATRRAMELLKAVKPDATVDNLVWFACYQEGSSVSSNFGSKDIAWLFYDGIEGFKDNPKRVEEFFEGEFQWMDEEYPDETDESFTKRFKTFFGV